VQPPRALATLILDSRRLRRCDRRVLAAAADAAMSVTRMRAGGGLISAGDPLRRGRLTVAAAQRARRLKVSGSAALGRVRLAVTTRPCHIWRRAAADARQLLGI
jgi:hypothetical protein